MYKNKNNTNSKDLDALEISIVLFNIEMVIRFLITLRNFFFQLLYKVYIGNTSIYNITIYFGMYYRFIYCYQ